MMRVSAIAVALVAIFAISTARIINPYMGKRGTKRPDSRNIGATFLVAAQVATGRRGS
jgi:hypothetical protein